MNEKWFVALGLLTVAALLLVGCQTQPTVEEIVAKMKEVEATTEDVHAVIEFSVRDQDTDREMAIEVWEKRDKVRAELIESNDPEFVSGAVVVSDGSQVWIYDPAEHEVQIGSMGSDTTSGDLASPRDVMRFMDEAIQHVLDHSEIELSGEQEVAGVETYKLDFSPRDIEELPFPVSGQGTLWVDQERWIVLQAEFSAEGVFEGRMRVRSFELNGGVEDERFRFQIPDGAEVTEIERKRTTHLTLDEARAQADWLMVPSYVPGEATLLDVLLMDGAFVLYYDHSTVSFTVVQGAPTMEQMPDGHETQISVRGQPATLIADQAQGNSLLTWSENGVTIVIAGRIDQEEIVRVAESLQ